jgi:hypothetical protein
MMHCISPIFFIILCHKFVKINPLEVSMGYKKMKNNLGFADFALASSLQHNCSLKLMDQLNSEILHQFEDQELTINEGIPADARLIKSASRPLSNDELKKHRDKKTPLTASCEKTQPQPSSLNMK